MKHFYYSSILTLEDKYCYTKELRHKTFLAQHKNLFLLMFLLYILKSLVFGLYMCVKCRKLKIYAFNIYIIILQVLHALI